MLDYQNMHMDQETIFDRKRIIRKRLTLDHEKNGRTKCAHHIRSQSMT